MMSLACSAVCWSAHRTCLAPLSTWCGGGRSPAPRPRSDREWRARQMPPSRNRRTPSQRSAAAAPAFRRSAAGRVSSTGHALGGRQRPAVRDEVPPVVQNRPTTKQAMPTSKRGRGRSRQLTASPVREGTASGRLGERPPALRAWGLWKPSRPAPKVPAMDETAESVACSREGSWYRRIAVPRCRYSSYRVIHSATVARKCRSSKWHRAAGKPACVDGTALRLGMREVAVAECRRRCRRRSSATLRSSPRLASAAFAEAARRAASYLKPERQFAWRTVGERPARTPADAPGGRRRRRR